MKTPMQELLALIPDAREIKEYISEVQPDEKMLDEWLWERMFKGRNWIIKEEEMAIGLITGFIYCKKTMTPREYFNQRYNQNETI